MQHRWMAVGRQAGLTPHLAESGEIDMNRECLEGKWKQFGGRVEEAWGELTNNQMSILAGRHSQLAGRMQQQYGTTKQQARRQLRDFLARNRAWDPLNR